MGGVYALTWQKRVDSDRRYIRGDWFEVRSLGGDDLIGADDLEVMTELEVMTWR